jgi:hypothetical protein
MHHIRIILTRFLTITVFTLWTAVAMAVDGVIEISGPTNITESGSYRLTQNISHTDSAIRIQVSNVSLDLNGFTISFVGTTNFADGIAVNPTVRNVEIKNGAITGFTRYGIFFPAGPNPLDNDAQAIMSDLRITQNNAAGISVEARRGVLIRDSVIANNGSWGVRMGTGQLLNSTVINNADFGLLGANNTGYGANVFFGNNGGGAQVSASPKQIGINICGTNTTCP